MTLQKAVVAFTQSEKIKSGIIWLSQALEMVARMPENHRRGAEKTARVFMSLMLQDIHLARKLTREPSWEDAEKDIDLALVMLDSGVAHECNYHLTRALSRVTDIGQRSMTVLRGEGLL